MLFIFTSTLCLFDIDDAIMQLVSTFSFLGQSNTTSCPYSSQPTVIQLIRVIHHITNEYNKNRLSAVVLLDLNKAFDSVWHKGLLLKLHKYKFLDQILKIISGFQQRQSRSRPIEAGVPQGSVLGPVPFNIYINDIPENPKTQLTIFADDTVILISSWSSTYLREYLQAHLNSLQNFFQDWKLKLNPTKSEAIIFHRKKPSNFKYPPPVKICSIDTPWENKVKYLGIIIDHTVRWRLAIEDRRIKVYITFRKFYPLVAKNNSLPLRLKRPLYLTCVSPILTYSAQLWGGVTH